MAIATWTISESDVYALLQLATQYNNDNYTLSFAASDVPSDLATQFVSELLELHEHKNDSFEPWGRQLARWANESVPVVVEALSQAGNLQRLTESGDNRVTEDGSNRNIEG